MKYEDEIAEAAALKLISQLKPSQLRRYEAAKLAAGLLRATTVINRSSVDPGAVITLAEYIIEG